LKATSPSLLLLTLETLLNTRLPLPSGIRLCSTPTDEIAVIKCILGVLANDLLAMDLTIIDPVRVQQGGERELEVFVMALAVVAKRKGVRLRVPSPEEVDEEVPNWEESIAGNEELPPPIQPDFSFSSSGSLSPTSWSQDVFGEAQGQRRPSASLLFDSRDGASEEEKRFSDRKATRTSPIRDTGAPAIAPFDMLDPYRTPLPTAMIGEHAQPNLWKNREETSLRTRSSGSQGSRTVLQHMMEEFGLGLDS